MTIYSLGLSPKMQEKKAKKACNWGVGVRLKQGTIKHTRKHVTSNKIMPLIKHEDDVKKILFPVYNKSQK